MKRSQTFCTACLGLTLLVASAPAQVELRCRVLDSAGALKTEAQGLRLVSSLGQTSGRLFVANPQAQPDSQIQLLTGFMGCLLLRPELDTDRDGLPDELDADNDGDTLADVTEIAGGSFNPATATNPNLPDSDGDGVMDNREALHRTDPTDETMYLRITELVPLADDMWRISWTARGGMTYGVDWYSAFANDFPGTDFGTRTAATGGVAPWFETSASAVLPSPANGPVNVYVQPR
jgi:hypothetical protein